MATSVCRGSTRPGPGSPHSRRTILAAQRGLLARVLADSPRSTFAAAAPPPVEPASETGAGATGFLPFALWIADELKRRALEVPGGGLGWSRLPGHAPETSLGAHVLYDGTAGIALFFAALAAVTRDPAWDEVAGAAISPVLRAIARERWDADRIGAGDGLGSLAYALMWIGRLANRADARAAAVALGRDLEGRVRADRHFDVLSGAAGAIVTCLALDADRRDSALVNTAMACADHLRANLVRIGDGAAWPGAGRQLFAGFAHGAAGIGCALWRLSQRTGDAGAADLARQAFHFERSLYLPGSGNWPISAAADNEQTGASASMTAWCHGAPGIALAHVLSPGAADDPDATARLQAALTTTARWAPGWADHLCCGTLGRVEVLWTAGRRLGVPAATAAAVTLATQVTGRARTAGHFRLEYAGIRIPGVRSRLLPWALGDWLPAASAGGTVGRARRPRLRGARGRDGGGARPSRMKGGTSVATEIAVLDAAGAQALETFTFPSYRHMLTLEPTVRHPGQGAQRAIQPVAVVAREEGAPVGMLVAELPLAAGTGAPEILSLFVKAEARNRGVCTEMVAAFERALARAGGRRVEAVYMTGKPGIPIVERVLAKRDWTPPETRAITVRFTPEEAASTPWFGRVRLPGDDYRIFAWSELAADEKAGIRRSHEASPWIEKGLEPWTHDSYGFDPVSSVGLRYRGTVVGWVINHQIAADTVRFTCSFMRKDLSRRGRILPLYTESIRRLAASGCRVGTLVTPLNYAAMAQFLRVRCADAVHFFGETRGSVKELG